MSDAKPISSHEGLHNRKKPIPEHQRHGALARLYLDPAKRSIGNSVQVFFRDGTQTERIAVEYPIGHRRRRKEGVPALLGKFERNLHGRIPARKAEAILALCSDRTSLETTAVNRFMDLFVV